MEKIYFRDRAQGVETQNEQDTIPQISKHYPQLMPN